MDILNKTGMEEYLMTLDSLIDVGSHSLSVESFKFKVSLTPSLSHPLSFPTCQIIQMKNYMADDSNNFLRRWIF